MYQNKYLKYKQKYFDLKNKQYGGSLQESNPDCTRIIKEFNKLYQQELKKCKPTKRNGLPNKGNTCFLNAFLQMFYDIDYIKDIITNPKEKSYTSFYIRTIFNYISGFNLSNKHIIDDIINLQVLLEFERGQQGDASEVYGKIINIFDIHFGVTNVYVPMDQHNNYMMDPLLFINPNGIYRNISSFMIEYIGAGYRLNNENYLLIYTDRALVDTGASAIVPKKQHNTNALSEEEVYKLMEEGWFDDKPKDETRIVLDNFNFDEHIYEPYGVIRHIGGSQSGHYIYIQLKTNIEYNDDIVTNLVHNKQNLDTIYKTWTLVLYKKKSTE